MATMKKAQLGGLIKKGVKAATKATTKKVVIPPGLQRSLKKSQSGPTKITQFSSEAEKIAAGGKTKLEKSKTFNRFDPNYQKLYKPKKQPTVDKYGFDVRPDRNGGTHKKAFLGSLLGGAGGAGLLGGLLGGGGGGMLGGLLGGGGGKGGAEGGGMGKISKMFGGSMKKGGKVAKKAKTGTSLGMKSVKAGVDKNPGVTRADIITAATKKAQNGVNKKPKLLTVSRTRQVADSLDNVASQKAQASINRTIGAYGQKGKGFDRIAQELNKSAGKDSDNATRYRKLADAASKKKKAKTGASVKKCRYGCK